MIVALDNPQPVNLAENAKQRAMSNRWIATSFLILLGIVTVVGVLAKFKEDLTTLFK